MLKLKGKPTLQEQYSESRFLQLLTNLKASQPDSNSIALVECVRNLAEFLCFSEQHGLDYFQEFISNDVLTLDLPRIL